MGNQEVIPSNIEVLRPQNWVEAGQDQEKSLFTNVNPYRRRLLANVITHELIEEYELNFITQQDYNTYVAQLRFREVKTTAALSSQSQNYIFPIRYFINKSKQEMCTTIHTGYLYADKVDLRLKQINDIPFLDLLYIYKATLTGFKTLYQKVGYFDIVEEMIFITQKGEVKVWINANLAKNYPNYEKASLNEADKQTTPHYQRQFENLQGSQADMICKLILLIEKNSDELNKSSQTVDVNNNQHQLFSEYLQEKVLLDRLSFEHSLQQFQLFLSLNRLCCPSQMRSILELFAPDQTQNNHMTNYQQSHINQLTSQNLTQIKKFIPMDTILENQITDTQTMHKPHYNQANFHQSLVAKFNPQQSFQTKSRKKRPVQSQQRRPLPANYFFTDMDRSRYSCQNNNVSANELLNMQKSCHSKSSTQNLNQKPHSVCSMNEGPYKPLQHHHQPLQYQRQHQPMQQQYQLMQQQYQPMQNQHKYQQHQHQHQHQPIQYQYKNQISSTYGNSTYGMPPNSVIANIPHLGPQLKEINQRFAVFNQPISKIRTCIEAYGGVYQNVAPLHQKFRKSSNQNSPKTKKVGQNEFIAPADFHFTKNFRLSEQLPTNDEYNLQMPRTVPASSTVSKASINQEYVLSAQKQAQFCKTQAPFKQKSSLPETQEFDKTKITYFTSKDQYQLDEQIAKDLEKFLGLKVS